MPDRGRAARVWVLVAFVGSRPIGLASAVHSITARDGVYIEEVAVVVEHQGRGIGPALLWEMAAWMREVGRPSLSIHPMDDDRWVRKVGFEPREPGSDDYVVDARDVVARARPPIRA